MDITWHGHSFFEIQGKANGEKIVVAIDPFDEKIGIKPKKARANILLLSHYHNDHSNKKIVFGFEKEGKNNAPVLIDEPGEYEVGGAKIKSIASFHDRVQGKEKGENNIFIIEMEGIKVCHMGDFNESELSKEQASEIVGTDIILIPVGGKFTISGKEAAKIIGQIEPKMVIPMHYKVSGVNLDIDDESKFLNVIGFKEKEKISKLKIQKSELERKEGTEIVIMERT